MTKADAVELAWTIGGHVMVPLALLVVILTGMAVVAELRR